MIQPAILSQAVFARLATDAAGAGVRALLGQGADSVLTTDDLMPLNSADLLARVPCVALRREAITSPDRLEFQTVYTWYGYDDPAVGYARLDALIPAIADAYMDFADGTHLLEIEVQAGRQDRDRTLGLLVQLVELVISAV